MTVKSKIVELFQSYRKSDILDILEFFRIDYNRSMRKSELFDCLVEIFSEEPEFWMESLLERDIKLLKTLVEKGPDKPIYVEYPDYPSIIETLKIIDSDNSDANFLKLSISPEIAGLVAPHIDTVLEWNERNSTYMLERLILGYLNIYGVIPADYLVDMIVEKMNLNGNESDVDSCVRFVSKNALLKIFGEVIDGTAYFFSPSTYDYKDIIKERIDFPEAKDYKTFPLDLILEAGSNAPYSCYNLDGNEGRKLKEMLSGLGYDDEELMRIIHDIWMNSQFTVNDESTENLFASITARQEFITDFENYKYCIDAIVEYANSLPKWLLKGHSANELDLMKITIKVDDGDWHPDSPADEVKVKLHYDLSSLISNQDKAALSWMIFYAPEKAASRKNRTVLS